jgi:hypothetical protein
MKSGMNLGSLFFMDDACAEWRALHFVIHQGSCGAIVSRPVIPSRHLGEIAQPLYRSSRYRPAVPSA